MFLFILILTNVVHLSRPYDTVNRDFLQPDNASEVLAIDSNYDNLAVATRENIFIYSQDPYRSSAQGNLLGKIRLPSPVSKSPGFIELKLLGKQQIFYCEQVSCRFCTLSRHNSSCSNILVEYPKKQSKEIKAAAVTRAGEKIILRVVDATDKAAILTYDIQDSGETKADQVAEDASFINDQRVLLGFTRGKHAYFVGSAQQPNEPLINARLIRNGNLFSVKVSRVCSNDQTLDLESRIDQFLSCPESGIGSTAVAAHYDSSKEQLRILFQESNANHTICKFDMSIVDKRISDVWKDCQNVTLMDAAKNCEYVGKESELNSHCFATTRKSDSQSQSCARFGMDKEEFDNCELHRKATNSYRYGWLENFKPFEGVVLGRLKLPPRKQYGLFPDSKYSAVFVVVPDEDSRNVLRIRVGPDDSSNSPIVWKATSTGNYRSVGTSANTDAIFLSNGTKVSTVFISCPELYKTCDSLAEDGGWKDPLSCVWCPDEDKNQVISSYDKFNCRQPLSQVCPPVLDHANRNENHSEWEVFGTNMSRLMHSTIYVCDQPCIVNQKQSTNMKLHCFMQDGSEQDSNCEVRVAGRLGDYQSFSIRAGKNTNSVGTDTSLTTSNSSSSGKSSSKTWKAVVAVVAVVLILGALVVIIWFARKRMMNRAKDGDSSSRTGFTLSPHPHTVLPADRQRRTNTYVPSDSLCMENINLYDRIFRDINDEIKIPVDSLSLENQIGKGHYGVVNRATYTSPDGSTRKVACKMIKDNVAGVREFLAEALVMANFDHPMLLKLVGVAMADDHSPIIVTEYMINGDLVTYLKDKENAPTLRTLLTFAIEVAEGMEYLHSINYIHRDLAARNCMLDNFLKIRIADFGLCRKVDEHNQLYEPREPNRDLPLRWMSIEALADSVFTYQGDVWAFGVLLWELMTRGMIPYGTRSGYPLLEFLKRGERLDIPPYCPVQLYEDIMMPCWAADPETRPTFTQLVHSLEDLIRAMERSQNTQLYSHYERVSTTTPTAHSSANTGSAGFHTGLR